ncbi:PREDICTED: uncharacterized protein LOC109114374 [Nelumbo nucifera]|uniref:Uncharacterized protein LOC109114374 n=1 Tax=Nelumbo nucifera TaxID=4432 RepID=A0A1U8Q353_NELNU|nr:PREDICTED: uncharacterized protein LOC109114374 [Nelumbo nucifera]
MAKKTVGKLVSTTNEDDGLGGVDDEGVVRIVGPLPGAGADDGEGVQSSGVSGAGAGDLGVAGVEGGGEELPDGGGVGAGDGEGVQSSGVSDVGAGDLGVAAGVVGDGEMLPDGGVAVPEVSATVIANFCPLAQ